MSSESDFYESMIGEQKAAAQSYRAVVRTALRRRGVTYVSASYDGYGDDGQIEPAQFTGASQEDLADYYVPPAPPHPLMRQQRRPEEIPLSEGVNTLFYEILEAHHGGWELEEGSYGEIQWDIGSDMLRLIHNNRFIDVETTEWDL